MKALVVTPRKVNSAQLAEVAEPPLSDGTLLVEMVAIGICGTDREIISGKYGWAPAHSQTLTLGHESLGRVLEAPQGSGFLTGDLVVGIVRRPDPVPCSHCAVGDWDMCSNGLYTERGIKERNGYCSERYRLEPEFAIKVDKALGELGVLLEPTSVMAKAWSHSYLIGNRSLFSPKRVLITGAGPVGLLAALIGKLKKLEVHVLDRVATGPKPKIVADLGAVYHSSFQSLTEKALDFDLIFECTGVANLVFDVATLLASGGILCLAGIASPGRKIAVDAGSINTKLVLGNEVIFGSVNAGREHYKEAANYLAAADPKWLSRLISRRVAMAQWPHALDLQEDDIKNIIVPQ